MTSLNSQTAKPRENAFFPKPEQRNDPHQASDIQDRQCIISNRAYELHSERGYREGYALEDWLDAEQEVLSQTRTA